MRRVRRLSCRQTNDFDTANEDAERGAPKNETVARALLEERRIGVAMDYRKAIAICGAALVTAVALGTAALAVDARSAPAGLISRPSGRDLGTRRITYADLDLASVPGERKLNRRVGGAIRSLCSEAARFDGTVEANNLMSQCHGVVWQQARPQIDRAVQRARGVASTRAPLMASAAIVLAVPN